MDNSQKKDVLDKIGIFIAYKQIVIFTIILLYACHITYKAFSCPICGDNSLAICKIFTGALLVVITAMFILAFILSLGITMRQAEFLRPWLLTTVVMVILCIVMLTLTRDIMQIILGTLVLFFQVISWYPIYKLYKRYFLEGRTREEQRPRLYTMEENFLMNGLSVFSVMSATLPYNDSLNPPTSHCEKPPPSYEEVMGIEAPPPCFADVQNWLGAAL